MNTAFYHSQNYQYQIDVYAKLPDLDYDGFAEIRIFHLTSDRPHLKIEVLEDYYPEDSSRHVATYYKLRSAAKMWIDSNMQDQFTLQEFIDSLEL